ncbi:tRNA pseudouridine(55) synthase TruB [Leptospira sp. 2 VSF19]|uniref:tRNA pseudouridine synthase B n=1 Tax=Leptospira soteropolitanensis TaxID=2950025 RepID=A0AAW5VL55_9LEPT|nr:tRNA pseudouridine(55) synthase TruB [Leptospira soteropolitanensis]MCW7492359.1 tRNA pseudouridine(55) synthase TruB [Leptospira soteropolitanensis]MCW7499941.1 tRNA pseudouridine(55) synthase TruB [Leptospira soteropolitanensis]MCW7522192.1 tRNA pseudouridine(55) synthase TruB [Leptospira soteropolitanensis]MCW7526046.1 tRNA pseudouridine(55) synthase TruB [Leptospira soteropolitanensis]MCW7529840.1 tRNA pseudouridine(55) synthase TruB [Leptospira soteropolitanensis]
MSKPYHSGFLFVYKPPGITSSDLVLKTKRILGQKSVGHTGTLDRFAEGLLILPCGDYTAFSQVFLGKDKSYFAEVTVGLKTDSGDPDGVVEVDERENAIPRFESDFPLLRLQEELNHLTRLTSQKAPKISALKVGGKRQSDLVREGSAVEEKERPIVIYKVTDIEKTEFGFSFRIHVSSGTYIRKIILDLSEKWGIPLSLQRLVRESIGTYDLARAKALDQISPKDLLPWKEIFPLPTRIAEETEKKAVIHGGYLWDKLPKPAENGFFIVDADEETILAWCDYEGKPDHIPYRYRKVFFDPSAKIMFSK